MTTQFLDAALPIIHSAGYSEISEYITHSIYVDRGILSDLPDIASKYAGRGFIVADSNTVALLNKEVLQHFDSYIIQEEYYASEKLVNDIKNASKNADFLIALGSGSINDICKYVSFITGKEYISFPTAPSMNGYTSPNASITMGNGIKKSLSAKLPKAIYIDVNVLTNAPQRMINSGFADFICRSTARADWLISSILLGTSYNELPFLITEASSQELLENYRGLKLRDSATIMVLMQALILSGIGMLIVGSSQPASQGEHIIAGVTELLDKHSFLHGERIGVSTLCMARLQKSICNGHRPFLRATLLDKNTLLQHFAQHYVHEFYKTLSKKWIDAEKAEHLNHIMEQQWCKISAMVQGKVIDHVHLYSILEYLEAPTEPEHVRWSTEQYYSIANMAFATRDRFTFLDIAHHAGISIS
ncbi:iron-containing alcohol dehydrogenase [Anaplasma phagocytophilum]|uniref:Iron-containing alcohol dehydrogenase family protein n=2 Tax=Anaplasma phagocytophilum TaxID=948 RepID=A0A0F3N9P1_ANAPH|nr:iron-containing alcohol dehydrogenase family protein [Anaplasma phagocytophilum str. ApMUC09]SCV64750.1 Glycerol-1-phosphate dehydrogenase [NAD(P)+] [Anaplasma phagocytophilum]